MTFLADCMLGKLARWLRILGYDTVYDNFAEDDDLLDDARAQDRILLTKDRPLADRALASGDIRCVFVNGTDLEDQIAQLVIEADLDLERPTFTRCLECNVAIVSVTAEEVESVVPPHVLETQPAFFRCSSCRRVYWAGSHTERMEAKLAGIRGAIRRRKDTVRA